MPVKDRLNNMWCYGVGRPPPEKKKTTEEKKQTKRIYDAETRKCEYQTHWAELYPWLELCLLKSAKKARLSASVAQDSISDWHECEEFVSDNHNSKYGVKESGNHPVSDWKGLESATNKELECMICSDAGSEPEAELED